MPQSVFVAGVLHWIAGVPVIVSAQRKRERERERESESVNRFWSGAPSSVSFLW